MVIYPKTFKESRFYIKRLIKKILPATLLSLYFSFFPFIGNLIYGQPSRKIKIIGVTGTDGKSSTVMLIARILQQAGYKVGYFSSVSFNDGVKEQANRFKMTMPGRLFIQRFLSTLVKNQCDFAVLEITSEGIKQKRHLFIDFDVAVCTNIKPEHIESHGGFANYKQAKAQLFENLNKSFNKGMEKIIVVGGDDEEARRFTKYQADQKITFGFKNLNSLQGELIKSSLFENVLKILGNEELIIKLKTGGPFILDNALAAIAVTHSLGVDLFVAKEVLENNSSVPGRFEIVSQKPLVIVDYAHTVAAVEKILSFVRKNWTGKIIHVFGAAGGGRDKWKRPKLAELSEKYTDFTILTEENSFDEPTKEILNDISCGFEDRQRVEIILKRPAAVAEALARANDQTLLLFTGKGCETVIAGALGRKTPYNEKETVCRLLNI